MIGDELVAASGQIIEKRQDTYVSRKYEVRAVGGTELTTGVPDPISRLRNTLTKAFKRFACLPKIIVVVVENTICNGIQVEEYGLSQHYGRAIEWVMDEHTDIIDKFKGYMPPKAKINRSGWPYILWVAPSIHDNYDKDDHFKRRKFTKCLEKIVHSERPVSSLRIMNHVWEQKDEKLADKDGKLMAHGWTKFWLAIDNLIQYFDEKIVQPMIEKKKAGEFTLEKFNDYKERMHQSTPHNISERPTSTRFVDDRRRSNYHRTHWSNFDNKQTTKQFGRQYDHGKFDKNNRRKLPTPSK